MPSGGVDLALGANDVDVVGYVDDLMAALPAQERTLLRCMFVMFDVQLYFTRPWTLRRLSKASPTQRAKSLNDWDKSDLYVRRAAFQALRSVVLWAYVDHPDVGHDMGIQSGTDITARRQADAAAAARSTTPKPASSIPFNGRGMQGTVAAPDPILAHLHPPTE
jgi:hypothetical protein